MTLTPIVPSSDIDPVSKISLGQQPSFMTALQCDVVMKIFSYVTQEECLTCMAVCRDWYSAIPQYTQSIWRELQLTKHDLGVDHQRRQLCLGSHVKRVVLQNITSVISMKRLVDWGCTKIKSLDLELSHTASGSQQRFIDYLERLGGSALTHLKLRHQGPIIPIPSILKACPELTYFAYITLDIAQWIQDEQFQQLIDLLSLDHHRTKITYLCLTITMITKKQLEWILKRCPMLRNFVIAPVPFRMPIIDIDSLFSWCPKIVLLAIGSNFSRVTSIEYPLGSTGLRYLDTTDIHGIDPLARCLVKHQSTLEHLSIYGNTFHFNWSPVIQSLQLPNLCMLELNYVECSATSLVAMLNQCPALETLQLKLLHIELSAFQTIRTMYHLVNLRLTHVMIDSRCMPAVFERFPALERLSLPYATVSFQIPAHFECPAQLKDLDLYAIAFTHIDNDISIHDTGPMVFFQRFTRNSNLEVIYTWITEPEIGPETLKSFAMIPTLRELEVHHHHTNLSSKGLLEFVKMLSKTRIEILKLGYMYELSFDVLKALASLSLLKTFSAGHSTLEFTHVDKEGLQKLLCTSPSLLTVEFCDVVLLDNRKQLRGYEVKALIEDETYWHDAKHSIFGRWKVRYYGFSVMRSAHFQNISIERADN